MLSSGSAEGFQKSHSGNGLSWAPCLKAPGHPGCCVKRVRYRTLWLHLKLKRSIQTWTQLNMRKVRKTGSQSKLTAAPQQFLSMHIRGKISLRSLRSSVILNLTQRLTCPSFCCKLNYRTHTKKNPLDDSRQINKAHQKELGGESQFNYHFTAFAAKQKTN